MKKQILIAGGGIGGLAAALACSRAGWPVQLLERTREFGEVGAGIQMGPNVVRILHDWGLGQELARVAAFPDMLRVRSADTGEELGRLLLGERSRSRYGAPYATIHRADIHQLLLKAVQQHADAELHMGQWVESFQEVDDGVHLNSLDGLQYEGEALIGADGLWSTVRHLLLNDDGPRVTGHLAYRALIAQRDLPGYLRSQQVTVWIGPDLHVVQYPVRRGHWLNVVGIVKGQVRGEVDDWDHATHAKELQDAMGGTCKRLQDLIAAIQNWRLWALCDRTPMTGSHEHARGRIALLGDAAHPMRPYMAQGAGMAIEDAACLEQMLTPPEVPMEQRLKHYAEQRWRRNARVQARSIRNGQIFHARGLVRLGRDLSMSLLGERLLDVPWLYRG
ncbi:MAG: FAD-dependent monooxygenase [Burkholderiales bacterium]|nr:FAD-dependent monooxygenase [Burkholderiales bacterium]